MTDAKFSWYSNFYGIAWRIHARNPIAVPLFVKEDEATKIAESVKTWNPKNVHLTFIENNNENYSICIFDEPDDSKNIGLYRSGMSQTGTYGKIKQMIEKKSSMWNPMRVYIQIAYAKDPTDTVSYQNMTDLVSVGRLEIISEAQLESDKFAIERDAYETAGRNENTTDEN
ncbi:MAG: hypothetical protein J4F36_03010 [Nitrosopumilaceae archaeon]|nr:hypothetical protein [Nitrosopumilaceae archaeon]